MATTSSRHRTTDGRTQKVADSQPTTEAKANADDKAELLERAKNAYPTPPLDTPVPSDPRLVQIPDGTATPAEANDRRVEKPAPEHVEAEAKTATVDPLPENVQKLKDHNQARIDAGENIEPVGPGNSTDMTDRGAPAGDLPDHEPGTFLHPQTKEQIEATKRYSEPHQVPDRTVYVTTPQGQKTFTADRTVPRSDGGVDIVVGTDPALPGKVVKTFYAGQWSYAGKTPQP